MQIVTVVNEEKMTLHIQPDEMLATTLRTLGFHSVRCGCDTTNCGLCTVWLDDLPVLSCAVPTFRIAGHKVTTLEGVQEEAVLFANYLAAEGADQCGFCSPGFIMSVLSLKRQSVPVTEDEIRVALTGNLCRCTGYMGQMRAVKRYLEVQP